MVRRQTLAGTRLDVVESPRRFVQKALPTHAVSGELFVSDAVLIGGRQLRARRHAAREFRAGGVDVSAHCAPYLTAPVAATTPGLRHLEWFHDHVRIVRELVDGYAAPIDGALRPADVPGHGLRLRGERAAEYRIG